MKHLRRSLIFLRPNTLLMTGAIISLVAVLVSNLLSPQYLQRAIDDGISASNQSAIVNAVIVLLLLALLRGVFSFAQTYLLERISQNVAFDMRNLLFNKLSDLSFSYHDQQQTGQLMTRVTSDVEVIRQFVGQGLLNLVAAVITVIGVIIVLVATNWQLAIVELLSIPIIFALIGFFISKVRPLFGVVQSRLGALNTILQENLAGIRVVRAFAREPYEQKRYLTMNEALMDVNITINKRSSVAFPLTFLTVNVATLLVVLVGGIKVINGTITVGTLVAFLSYLVVLIGPVFGIGFLATAIGRAAVSAERVFEVLDARNEVEEKPGARSLGQIRGDVEFRNVVFKFAGAEQQALDDVSLHVPSGHTVAIMGRTGSGKSSIINMIPRFYDPQSGQVLVDGIDVRDVTLDSLRGNIGMVLQDTVLFSGTIRDNIAYGRPEATPDEVVAAARAAQADEFIGGFPDGYDTLVGERGVGLSGGQKQRVAIARALLLNPRILILDDSTSAVDAETEYQIQQALDKLMRGRTSFVIAQRISTVRNADMIVLLDEGKIIATGTHDDLLRENALYGEIVDSQLRKDEPVAAAEEAN
ncbi:MAG: ABC transporter ATP-binding protein [Chloroflexi bacterium]|nr:ABC transporter ATP-binding protein [Chloroflexota bacterium]